MKIDKFFNKLGNYYNVDFDANGDWKREYGVNYYCQATTFSFEIYSQDQAYTGTPAFKSEVYAFWNNHVQRNQIMEDIMNEINNLIKKKNKK